MANDENQNPNILVRFARTPRTRFYMCRSCRTHLVSSRRNHIDRLLDSILCTNAVNVRPANVPSVWVPNRLSIVDVCCRQCNSVLGKKYALDRRAATPVVQGGPYILMLDTMLFWNGNQVVYADTQQPAGNN